MNEFREALTAALGLPTQASDGDILARATKVAADSSALTDVWCIAERGERKGCDLDASDVMDAINPDRGTR